MHHKGLMIVTVESPLYGTLLYLAYYQYVTFLMYNLFLTIQCKQLYRKIVYLLDNFSLYVYFGALLISNTELPSV